MALTSCSLLVHFDTLTSSTAAARGCNRGTASRRRDARHGSQSRSHWGPGPRLGRRADTGADAGADAAGPWLGKGRRLPVGKLDVDRCCNQTSVTTDQNAKTAERAASSCEGMQHCGTSPLSNGEYLSPWLRGRLPVLVGPLRPGRHRCRRRHARRRRLALRSRVRRGRRLHWRMPERHLTLRPSCVLPHRLSLRHADWLAAPPGCTTTREETRCAKASTAGHKFVPRSTLPGRNEVNRAGADSARE